MKLIKYIKESWFNLFSVKLRSFLALLGILVGSASVVAMVLSGQLATHEALKQFKALGTDLLAVSLSDIPEDEAHSGDVSTLTVASINAIKKLDTHVLDVAPYTLVFNSMQFNGQEINGNVLGVTENFAKVAEVYLEQGRFISNWDGYATFGVVGQNIGEQIKKLTFKNPIGEQIHIGDTIFTIVGIAKHWPENSFLYANVDNAVLIPIQASMALNKYISINNIILKVKSGTPIDSLEQNLSQYLNSKVPHKRLFFRSAKELIAKMSKQNQIFTVFLGLIGSIALIVGGIGVMNIMLVSVMERRREIGIRLAVGATKKDIRWLFLMEATMLSVLGGTMGILLGILISYAMSIFYHWEFIFFLLPPFIGFSVSVITGIFFGFYPAYKASQLDPIDGLRAE